MRQNNFSLDIFFTYWYNVAEQEVSRFLHTGCIMYYANHNEKREKKNE